MKLRLFKILIFSVLIMMLSSSLYCQQNTSNCADFPIDSAVYEGKLVGEHFYFTENHKGLKYLYSEWNKADVSLENGKKVTQVYVNYHLPSNEVIWFRSKDSKLIVLDKSTIKQFVVYSNENSKKDLFRKIKFRPFYLNDSVTYFLQVLSEGEISLFAHRRVMLTNNLTETIRDDNLYIKIGSGSLKFFKPNRWRLFAVVPKENRPLIKKIVRSNHLKIRREGELAKALELFNNQVFK